MGECGQLGYYSDKAPGRGSLYLLTREDEPFCGEVISHTIRDSGVNKKSVHAQVRQDD